jgi:hypothetical protein
LPREIDLVDDIRLTLEKLVGDKAAVNLFYVIELNLPGKTLIYESGEELMKDACIGEEILIGAVIPFSLGHPLSVYPARQQG